MTLRDTGTRARRTRTGHTRTSRCRRRRNANETPPNDRSNAGVLSTPEFMQHVEQSMFYAIKDDQNVTEVDVRAILAEHGLELLLSVEDLMRHWNW